MPELIDPEPGLQASFLTAMAEQPDNLGRFGVSTARLTDPVEFAGYVRALLADRLPETPRAGYLVPTTNLWWVDGNEFLGRLSIRHELNEGLRTVGGHIGYWIRPSARRRGHASAALVASLPRAAALGIDPVLVTCDDTNVGSRKVIERAGGVFEDRYGVKLRYWVTTRHSASR